MSDDRPVAMPSGRRRRRSSRAIPSPRSALIMLLHEAQDEVGYVTDDVIKEVGADARPHAGRRRGRRDLLHDVQAQRTRGSSSSRVCTNLSCTINGADETAAALRDAIGPAHERTADGLCSWESVECLATCHWAVAAQVNYLDVPYLTPERARKLVDDLRAGRDLDEILDELAAKSLAEARATCGCRGSTGGRRTMAEETLVVLKRRELAEQLDARRVRRDRRLPGAAQGADRDDAAGSHRGRPGVRSARTRRRRHGHRAQVEPHPEGLAEGRATSCATATKGSRARSTTASSWRSTRTR